MLKDLVPIATAPRDGSRVQLYAAYLIAPYNPEGVVPGRWRSDHFEGTVWNPDRMAYDLLTIEPTHWRPMPPAED